MSFASSTRLKGEQAKRFARRCIKGVHRGIDGLVGWQNRRTWGGQVVLSWGHGEGDLHTCLHYLFLAVIRLPQYLLHFNQDDRLVRVHTLPYGFGPPSSSLMSEWSDLCSSARTSIVSEFQS